MVDKSHRPLLAEALIFAMPRLRRGQTRLIVHLSLVSRAMNLYENRSRGRETLKFPLPFRARAREWTTLDNAARHERQERGRPVTTLLLTSRFICLPGDERYAAHTPDTRDSWPVNEVNFRGSLGRARVYAGVT